MNNQANVNNMLYKKVYSKEQLSELQKLKYIKYGSYFLSAASFVMLLKYWSANSNAVVDCISCTALYSASALERLYVTHSRNKINENCKTRKLIQ